MNQLTDLAEAPTEQPLASAPTSMQPANEPLALLRIVIADDSAAIRTLARHALSPQHGFSLVGEAADGSEALGLVEAHRPDCVVLDIEMPGMGGFEALSELRSRSLGVPVVLLSGHSDASVADRARGGGAAALLDKSTQFVLLAETIRQAVLGSVQDVRTSATESPAATRLDEPVATVPAGDPVPSERADALAAELRRLEYVVSHDLGEPLRIMSGFATLLESRYGDVLDASGTSFVNHIAEASRRMQEMIADLLTYSRAGQLQPRADDVDLSGLVATVYQELADQLAERGAEATVGDLTTVVGDRDLLQVVLRHLVVNAITFNTATVPKVHITAHQANGSSVVTVTDNGIGIDPANNERAFDLFQRFNARGQYPGTGTGLALCRRLVTLQHGTLQLDAAPEVGSIVTLTMPARTPRMQQAQPTDRRLG